MPLEISNPIYLSGVICLVWMIITLIIGNFFADSWKLKFKLYIFNSIYFAIIVPAIFYLTNNQSLIYAMLMFGLFAVTGEYTFSYCFHKLCGFRLYEYDRGNILGYTSYLNVPLYCGGFLFIYILNSIILKVFRTEIITQYSYSASNQIFIMIFAVTSIALIIFSGLSITFPASDSPKPKLKRYVDIIMTIFLYVVVVMGITTDLNILILFIANFALTWTGEVMLGFILESGAKYQHWKYNKYTIFQNYTSPLIFPLWGLAGVLVYCLMVIFR